MLYELGVKVDNWLIQLEMAIYNAKINETKNYSSKLIYYINIHLKWLQKNKNKKVLIVNTFLKNII